jgi:hypothetical protein
LPKPQSQRRRDDPPPVDEEEPKDVEPDDCYKGLGNCPGSFRKALREEEERSEAEGEDSSSSSFGDALQELIDAASDGFDSVRRADGRPSGDSVGYPTTLVPDGMRHCAVFIPRSSMRRRWLSCYPLTGMSRSRLVALVADSLDDPGSRDSSGQTWSLGGIEVSVETRLPLTLRIRPSRD